MPAIPPSYPAHLSPRRAKLRPPRLPGDMVLRLRLLAYLNRMAALTLVVAPAGYGKTTLVASWLAQLQMPTGWLSLDSENNEPLSFLAALIAAMDNILPGFGKDIATTLNAPNSSSWSALTVALINELDALTDEFVLVLDDYHYIREQAVHQLIIELVTYPPKAMHLVLTARHDPPLPWRTRVRVDLCEIRAADMGFTADEAMEFLTKAVARPIAGADARLLVEQSQGWVTSLRLAALSMRNQSANATWSGLTNVNFLNFNDYFSEEVLLDLEPELLNFLLQTSVLDLLSGPLCDFVVGGVRSEAAGADPGPRLPAKCCAASWRRRHPRPRLRAFTREQRPGTKKTVSWTRHWATPSPAAHWTAPSLWYSGIVTNCTTDSNGVA
jgi:LuxR family maltose regulon positive regulatory protein